MSGLVRKAVFKDVPRVYEIVETFARKGWMLHRSVIEISSNLRDFFVYEEDDAVLGVAALHICWEGMGEIRSLAVKEGFAGRGIGRELVAACLDEARTLGIEKVFALTYKTGFFERMGFKDIDKMALPHKIWGECVACPKFPGCDENAVIIEIGA
ncbi:MAG: N-acetyltransferase [Deltaproteobacteria bacterium]|nr:N-acetyltransferase [Deltaproteobacteria bacterium]